MTRHDDSGVRTVVSGICTTYMPRIIFDWHDGLIIFTIVGSHVITLVTENERVVRCAERTVMSAVEFVSDSSDSILLAHVSHQSELSGVAFLHVMQHTGDACLST